MAILILSSRRGRLQLTGPVCGSCGYSVLGLTNMICPECGSDLRCVGILTANTRPQTARAVVGMVVFTVVVFVVGFCATSALIGVVPAKISDSEQVQLKAPESGAYQGVILSSGGAFYVPKPAGLPVRIDLTGNPNTATASWLLANPDGSYEYVANGLPRVVRPSAFATSAVLEWMKAAGIDVGARSVAREAARITGETLLINRNTRRAFAIDAASSGNSVNSGGGRGAPFGTYVYTQRAGPAWPDWPPPVLLLLWIVLWACGMRYLVGQRRRVPGR